jgi:hypothetical protein
MPRPPEPRAPAKSAETDVVDVIDRTALVENILNQIVVDYCAPRRGAFEFMWSVVLDTSIMPFAAKLKVVMAVAHEMQFKLDRDALHKVMALRNAFAHHASNARPVLVVERKPEESTSNRQLWVLEASGKISRIKRDEAISEFNVAYRAARDSLVQLRNLVREKCKRNDA